MHVVVEWQSVAVVMKVVWSWDGQVVVSLVTDQLLNRRVPWVLCSGDRVVGGEISLAGVA